MQILKSFLSVILLCFPSILFSTETIKIGIAGPFTGSNAAFGEQQWQGALLAAENINAKGGIHIELIKADDACEPKQAVTVANWLVNDHNIKAVVGHFCSSSTIPASNIYDDAQVLMVTPASTNPLITERNLKMLFRTCGRDDQQGKIAADFIVDKLHAKNIAIIHDKDTYGKGLADAVKTNLEKRGTHIALYEGLTRGEKDFNALVTKIKEVKADAVYFGGMHPEAGPLVRQLREEDLQIPFISGDGIVSEDFVTSVGGAHMLNNVYMTFNADARALPQAQDVVATFRKHHFEPEGYTLYSYAALQAIATAMQNVQTINGPLLADWLHAHPVDTLIGKLAWDQKGDLLNANYVMYQWNKQGKYLPVK